MPSWQKSNLERNTPSLPSISCIIFVPHELAPEGCSNMNNLPAASCFRHKHRANRMCIIASFNLTWISSVFILT